MHLRGLPAEVQRKKIVVLRSAFGLLDSHKKGAFPLHELFYKYIRYKVKHPFVPVYVAGFMANPLMYAMICKYTRRCYPKSGQPVPEQIAALKKNILAFMSAGEKEQKPFVLKIHFQVRFNGNDKKRFTGSKDEDVKYFLAINPDYNRQTGVLVIVPVTVANMAYAAAKYLARKLRKRLPVYRFASSQQKPVNAQ